MARPTSDDLYRLIHSLTPEEKSYFKKFARRHGSDSNLYLSLFDDVNQQQEFDEKPLRAKYKIYFQLKPRLFEAIVKSLWVSRKESDPQVDILQQLISSYILTDKGMLDKAQQILDKALKRSRTQEMFFLEGLVLKRSFSLSKMSWAPSRMKEKMMEYVADIEAVLKKERNKLDYQREHIKLYLNHMAIVHSDQSIAYKEEPVNEALLEDASAAFTTGNNRQRQSALIAHYQLTGNYEKAYEMAKKLFAFESRLVQLNRPEEDYANYILSLRSLISLCHATGRVKEVEGLLQKAWKAPAKNEKEKLENFLFFVYKKVLLYWDSGRHSEGEKFLAKNIEDVVDKKNFERYIAYVLDIVRFKILFQFSNQNYREAVLSIYDFESLNIKKYSPKYYKDCEMIKILIQAETGHYEQMENFIKNMFRKPKQLNPSPLERKFFLLLKKMNDYNRRNIYKQLFQLMTTSGQDIAILWGFNLKDWLQGRLANQTLSEVFKNKIAARNQESSSAKG